MSNNFWDNKPQKQVKPWEQSAQEPSAPEPVVLDEAALQTLQQDENLDIFEEEEESVSQIMLDANLRLEQGRLYQMILQNNIFVNTNADPRAIKNVQREVRKFVRERMETMLGIRQELPAQEAVVSSPFNDLEVTVLKMLASKMSKGATEESNQPTFPSLPPPSPKKDGITSISGNLRPNTTKPLSASPKVPIKPQAAKQQVTKTAIKKDEPKLEKPIDQMTPEELAAHDAAALERSNRNYAAKPANMVPHPTQQELEMRYTIQANQLTQPGSAISAIMAKMSK